MKKLRVLLVGAAFSADLHSDGYSRILDKVDIVGICDKDLSRIEALANRYGFTGYTAYDDYNTAIANCDCDLVDICMPNFLHHDVAIKAMNAGHDIICEKPLATTVEDAQDMVDTANRLGKHIYAVGSNPEAAKISGIQLDRVKIIVYTINGGIAGLAGAMYTSFYASAQGNMADGAEMDVIAACVIGGVSLNGGQGSAFGVLLGAITVAIIGKSLSLVGIDAFWQQALKGAVILVAVVINVMVQRNAARKALEGREI
mgnify:CR=1 FL=1